METIGYSTGSLAGWDFQTAVRLLDPTFAGSIELSALRTHELPPLLAALPEVLLDGYHHISVHAPSAFTPSQEPGIAASLMAVAQRGWLVILHPDTIHDFRVWEAFGDRLCIENMDVRKPIGRTVEELWPVFARLPEASFCFDMAHARQFDPSMREAARLLHAFGERLGEVHVSELDANSRHVRLSREGIQACLEISDLIPVHIPVIIEAPVSADEIELELSASLEALGRLVTVDCGF